MRISPWLLLLLAGGAAWNIWPAGAIILSLLLPVGVMQARSKGVRWTFAFVWFLAGSISIVPSAVGFFGPSYLMFGIAAWLASSALLALPWIIADTPIKAVIAVILDAVPPIGLIGWLSPLTAAGWLFPGQGLAGVAGCLLVILCSTSMVSRNSCHGCKVSIQTGVMGDTYWLRTSGMDDMYWLRTGVMGDMYWLRTGVMGDTCSGILKLMTGILVVWVILANLLYTPVPVPKDWIGIQTSIPPSNGNVLQAIANNRALIAAAQTQGAKARYLLFPEAVLDDWYPGTRAQIAAAIPPGQTWILGAETLAPGARYDALVIAQRHHALQEPVFRAALPMPVSMWRPGFAGSFQATWHEPVQNINGHRVWASICFDQVLPWVWIDGMMQHPNLILLPSNDWWAQKWNPAPEIQKEQADAWNRLMGTATVGANNKFAIRNKTGHNVRKVTPQGQKCRIPNHRNCSDWHATDIPSVKSPSMSAEASKP